MKIPKNYFHDRGLLLVLSLNVFLAFSTLVLLVFRLSGSHSIPYIAYRQNQFGNSVYTAANSSWQLLIFGVFALLVLGLNMLLSMRMYRIHRQLSVVVLVMGTILLAFNVAGSYHLLQLFS